MKKILSIIVLTIILFSCNNGSTSTPSGTVTGFFEAAKKADETAFKNYLSKDDLAFIASMEAMAKQFGFGDDKKQNVKDEFVAKAKNASFKILSEKIEGDKATVDVEIKEAEKTEKQTMNLVKEEGKWKLSLFGGMKDEIQKAMSGLNGGLDSLKGVLKDVNMDSLGGKINNMLKDVENNKGKFEELMKEAEKASKEFEKTQK
jgi:hypothetical protein